MKKSNYPSLRIVRERGNAATNSVKEMKKFFLAVCFPLMVFACDAQASGREGVSAPSASREKEAPVIAVSGSEIKINGTTVWLGDSLTAWKRVLGGTPACYDTGGIVTCVWHANGFSLGTNHLDKTRVTFMNLHVTIEPPKLGERALSWPKSSFNGTLKLDGIPINAGTAFRDLRQQVAHARELRCGGRDCGNPTAAFSDGASIYMSLAGRSDTSRILRFSISCSSTKSCMALMPSHEKK